MRTSEVGRPAPRRSVMALAAVLAALALLAGACSGGDDESSSGDAPVDTRPGDAEVEGEDGPGGEADGEGSGFVLPERFVGHDSEVYGELENWVCHPDRSDDGCDIDLTTTVVSADGATSVREVEPDPDAPVDCFYVYPTINPGPGPVDEAMGADTFAEDGVVALQLAQLAPVCRIYAPIYRQITLAAIGGSGGATPEMREQAYADVADSFAHYMANHNDGRPVVLYGHSQGSGLLAQLVADEFDGDEVMTSRLVSALLIGSRVATAVDAPTGGSFQHIPVCATTTSTGCVVGFSAVAPGATEAILTAWGSAAGPGQDAGAAAEQRKVCVNPAGPGEPAVPLHSIVASAGDEGGGGPLDQATPYVALEGALSGTCVDHDGKVVLEVSVAEEQGWSPEGLEGLTTNIEFWGLHIVEVNLLLGDLVELVRTQTDAFGA